MAMSIQLATAAGGLVSLGVGVGDVAAIISYGKRIGNWWTGPSGDAELLKLLDEDGNSVFQRRGLLDIQAFNKRWRKQIDLLANGRPLRLQEKEIEKVLGDPKALVQDLSVFTGVMTCLVAVLDQFTSNSAVRSIIHDALRDLLKLHEGSEDILRSHYPSRLNAWRSIACLRGLNHAVEKCRAELIKRGNILSGRMPEAESSHMGQFIRWLLGTNEPGFKTASSDVAGVAVCLRSLGLDSLQVQADGFPEISYGECTVIYSKQPFLHDSTTIPPYNDRLALLERHMVVTIPLQHPEETVSVFPISLECQNQCRTAWKCGQSAAKTVAIGFYVPVRDTSFVGSSLELRYTIVDRGNGVKRTSAGLDAIVRTYGLVKNRELVDALNETLGSTQPEILSWLYSDLRNSRDISNPDMTDKQKIDAFCVFQSFFMGYYYTVFGRLVCTSSLLSQTVEGAWGFREPGFLDYMASLFGENRNAARLVEVDSPHRKTDCRVLTKRNILSVLARLFLGKSVESDLANSSVSCLGIVGKRTLLSNSLLGKCSSPKAVASFTLLDVDVGGIPRDHSGLIRAGLQSIPFKFKDLKLDQSERLAHIGVNEKSPEEDVTLNIEPDWEGNPDTSLLCARYKGRRVATFSPAVADMSFCDSYISPRPQPHGSSIGRRSTLARAVEVDISAIIENTPALPLLHEDVDFPIIFQAFDQPCLRYFATVFYKDSRAITYLATDSVERAMDEALSRQGNRKKLCTTIIVAGMADNSETDIPKYLVDGFMTYEIPGNTV
ncbi:hypothetical protein F4777DRAFT_544049 [Nemania sp. FL0916]|nr:hypothetical protein F4777DRAFT_544049 [Nemania sp. FL0916]